MSLHVRGLCKSYGNRVIVEIPDLALKRGSSYLLTGNNGAGKTTLLRILAGLEPAQLESMHFDGTPVPLHAIRATLACKVMYLHQQPYLFNTSIKANIGYGLKAAGMSRQQQALRIDEAMSWAGVSHLAHVPSHRLSGGEKQRVALARARVINPTVWLLDEPTANLDEDARKQVTVLVRQMCDNNHCVVMATHDPELMNMQNSTTLRLENKSLYVQS